MIVTDQAVGIRKGVRQQAGELGAGCPDLHSVEAEPDVQCAVLNRQLNVDASIGGRGGFTAPRQRLVQRGKVDGKWKEDLLTHVVANRDAGSRSLVTPPALHDVANRGGLRSTPQRTPYGFRRVSPDHDTEAFLAWAERVRPLLGSDETAVPDALRELYRKVLDDTRVGPGSLLRRMAAASGLGAASGKKAKRRKPKK